MFMFSIFQQLLLFLQQSFEQIVLKPNPEMTVFPELAIIHVINQLRNWPQH